MEAAVLDPLHQQHMKALTRRNGLWKHLARLQAEERRRDLALPRAAGHRADPTAAVPAAGRGREQQVVEDAPVVVEHRDDALGATIGLAAPLAVGHVAADHDLAA